MATTQNQTVNAIIESVNRICLAASNYFASEETINMDNWRTRFIIQCLQALESILIPEDEARIQLGEMLCPVCLNPLDLGLLFIPCFDFIPLNCNATPVLGLT